jgi:HPt (histidine-containing phosphotransfer) domain-containing protein
MSTQPTAAQRLVSELANDPDMLELVEMFVQELPQRVSALRQAITQSDLDSLQRLAHQLKGAAGGYGFPTITAAAKDLELTAKTTQDLEKMKTELEALAGLCARASANSA